MLVAGTYIKTSYLSNDSPERVWLLWAKREGVIGNDQGGDWKLNRVVIGNERMVGTTGIEPVTTTMSR